MDEELQTALAVIREATGEIQQKPEMSYAVGRNTIEAIKSNLGDPVALVEIYRKTSEPPFDLDVPFFWDLRVTIAGTVLVSYADLFERLGALVDELEAGDMSA